MIKLASPLRPKVAKAVRGFIHRLGFDITRRADGGGYPSDFSASDIEVIEAVRPFTMTGPAAMFALIRAVEYVVAAGLEGSIVECGVWRGGSMMVIAKTLLRLGAADRDLYLYDTFEGMTPPTQEDASHDNSFAVARYDALTSANEKWCYASEEEVRHNVLGTGYPKERIHFVRGPVERTLTELTPDRIALLRLDTDWYESTKAELEILYPKLLRKGVLIIDDYGHWKGARKATDEYFSAHRIVPYLMRADYTSRVVIRT